MGIMDQQHHIQCICGIDPSMRARITISVHDNGGVCVSGNIGDEQLAKIMLDAARDAVSSHHAKTRGRVLVPGSMAGVQQDAAFPFGPVCPT